MVSFSFTILISTLEPPPICSAAAGDAAATAATVVIAAADAAVAVTLHFASFTTFCVAAAVEKQHEPLLVDGVGGVGGEIITAFLKSEIQNSFHYRRWHSNQFLTDFQCM